MKRPWKAAAPANGASPTNAPTTLVRSKTGSESIRGRISSPIPIPNPLDEEFPMRNPGTGIAKPVGSENPEPVPESGNQPAAAPAVVPVSTAPTTAPPPVPAPITISASPESDKPAPSPVTILRSQTSPPRAQASPPRVQASPPQAQASAPRRTNNAAVRQSTISVESAQTSSTKNQPQRKKSTLRGALGKLFGRKKKRASQEVSDAGSKATPHSSMQPVIQADQKRSISLPVSQYDRALRSHSVGPEDVLAIESARNSLHVDLTVPRRRTGPGENYFVHTRRATDGGWMGLSPRPASSQGRTSRNDRHDSDPEDIGRAITCDDIAKRRRSRSLSGLPNLDENRPGTRRRSDEIRYWRESYVPNFGPPLVASTDLDQMIDVPAPAETTPAASDEQASSPLQPFAFGNIATMNEMAGMKITQAVSMDTRIGNLEARMYRVEDVVTQLCNAVPEFKPRADASDQAGAQAVGGTRPSTRHSAASRTSFGDATFVASTTARSTVLPPSMPFHRPMSLATIRGTASLPTLTRDSAVPLTMEQEQYAKLIQLVETERAARVALEAQIKTLSHQIDLMGQDSAYRKAANVVVPQTGKSFASRSAFDLDDDDDADDTVVHGQPYRESLTLEDSGIVTGVTDDDYSETFTTPYEAPSGFVVADDDTDEENAITRKAARTLSLSQLTLGTGQKPKQEPLPQSLS